MENVVEDLNSFYKNKNVLVTGHTGFKGAWLCLWLKELGANVSGYSLAPLKGDNLYKSLKLTNSLDSTYGDIRDLKELRAKFKKAKPEIVFHLAAQPLVLPSYEDPLDTFSTNIMGSLNVLEAALKSGSVKTIVNITTDKCYEPAENVTFHKETDQLGGYDPYSSSKAAVEIVSSAFRRSFLAEKNIAMATGRAGNVIGGGDFAEYRLIPDIYRAKKNNKAVIIRNPGNIRPWQHVLDALHGYLILGAKLGNHGQDFASAFNFGPDNSDVNVKTLAHEFALAIDAKEPVIKQDADAPHESYALRLDNNKAKNDLGWQPLLNTQEAIEWSGLWYREFLSNPGNIAEFTNSQLSQFRVKTSS